LKPQKKTKTKKKGAAEMPSISVHIEKEKIAECSGQTRHDLRIKIPSYVNKIKTSENSILIKPRTGDEMLKICKNLRDQRGIKREMKKNCNVAIAGIITFSKNAQKIIESLDKDKQNELFLKAGKKITEHLNLDLSGLVIHRDETAIHCHFQMPGYNRNGFAMSDLLKPSILSELQDVASEAFLDYGIGRGVKKTERIANGEDYSKYIHRSVKQLHDDLPRELAELRKLKAEMLIKIEKDKGLIEKTQAKIDAGTGDFAKLEKNLAIYKKRENDKLNELAAYDLEISEKETKLTEINDKIANSKQTLDKYKEILKDENPPKMPKSRIIKEKESILSKATEIEIIELNDFKKYDKDKTMWAVETFDKENKKKKDELDKRETDITEKEAEINKKVKSFNTVVLGYKELEKKVKEKDELLQNTAKKILETAGIETRNIYLEPRKAADILKNFVQGGISAVKSFWQKLQNSLSR